ncbi:MAG: BON domain-containing protein [Pyrinomonadaceae bacterium]
MGNYYARDDDWDRETERNRRRRGDERYRGRHYGGAYERDRERDAGRYTSRRYGTGWPEDDRRDVGRRRDFGRSYRERDYRDSYPSSSERYYEGTYRPPDYGRDYTSYADYQDRLEKERDWFDRASDELASWFGDEGAERRRRLDKMRGNYRGRGPKGYKRSDERIKEDVNDRLSDDPYLDASDVEVTVINCEVALSGTVDSRNAKRRAENVIESVCGVTNIENGCASGKAARMRPL